MTTPTLPTELLIKIFSIVSSTSDLYHSLLCSKELAEVVRPVLYDHITIETSLQRETLKRVREEDKKSVRKLTIKGDGPIEISKMEEHFESKEGCKLGGGCLLDLYEGKLLDVSTIGILHIINIHEDPRLPVNIREVKDSFTVHKTPLSHEPKTASSLIEIQISHHQGGGYYWSNLLPITKSPVNPIHPACKRFGYTHVTFYELPPSDPPSHSPSPLLIFHDIFESATVVGYNKQLELEISKVSLYLGGPFIKGTPGHLVHISTSQLQQSLVDGSFGYDVLIQSQIWIDSDASTLNAIFSEHHQTRLPQVRLQPRFLLLPSGAVNIFEGYDVDCSKLEIHYYTPEERDSFLLIPPQFVDYVERMKRLEPEEAKAGFLLGV